MHPDMINFVEMQKVLSIFAVQLPPLPWINFYRLGQSLALFKTQTGIIGLWLFVDSNQSILILKWCAVDGLLPNIVTQTCLRGKKPRPGFQRKACGLGNLKTRKTSDTSQSQSNSGERPLANRLYSLARTEPSDVSAFGVDPSRKT